MTFLGDVVIGDCHKASVWHKYFAGKEKKDEILHGILNKTIAHFKVYYSFLTTKQILGKSYAALGIPNRCGEVDRKRLYEMFLKNRISEVPVKMGKASKPLQTVSAHIPESLVYKSILKTNVKQSVNKSIKRTKVPTSVAAAKRLYEDVHRVALDVSVAPRSRKSVRFYEGVEIFNISPIVTRQQKGETTSAENRRTIEKISEKEDVTVAPNIDCDSDDNHDGDTFFDSDFSDMDSEERKKKQSGNEVVDWVSQESVDQCLKKIELLEKATLSDNELGRWRTMMERREPTQRRKGTEEVSLGKRAERGTSKQLESSFDLLIRDWDSPNVSAESAWSGKKQVGTNGIVLQKKNQDEYTFNEDRDDEQPLDCEENANRPSLENACLIGTKTRGADERILRKMLSREITRKVDYKIMKEAEVRNKDNLEEESKIKATAISNIDNTNSLEDISTIGPNLMLREDALSGLEIGSQICLNNITEAIMTAYPNFRDQPELRIDLEVSYSNMESTLCPPLLADEKNNQLISWSEHIYQSSPDNEETRKIGVEREQLIRETKIWMEDWDSEDGEQVETDEVEGVKYETDHSDSSPNLQLTSSTRSKYNYNKFEQFSDEELNYKLNLYNNDSDRSNFSVRRIEPKRLVDFKRDWVGDWSSSLEHSRKESSQFKEIREQLSENDTKSSVENLNQVASPINHQKLSKVNSLPNLCLFKVNEIESKIKSESIMYPTDSERSNMDSLKLGKSGERGGGGEDIVTQVSEASSSAGRQSDELSTAYESDLDGYTLRKNKSSSVSISNNSVTREEEAISSCPGGDSAPRFFNMTYPSYLSIKQEDTMFTKLNKSDSAVCGINIIRKEHKLASGKPLPYCATKSRTSSDKQSHCLQQKEVFDLEPGQTAKFSESVINKTSSSNTHSIYPTKCKTYNNTQLQSRSQQEKSLSECKQATKFSESIINRTSISNSTSLKSLQHPRRALKDINNRKKYLMSSPPILESVQEAEDDQEKENVYNLSQRNYITNSPLAPIDMQNIISKCKEKTKVTAPIGETFRKSNFPNNLNICEDMLSPSPSPEPIGGNQASSIGCEKSAKSPLIRMTNKGLSSQIRGYCAMTKTSTVSEKINILPKSNEENTKLLISKNQKESLESGASSSSLIASGSHILCISEKFEGPPTKKSNIIRRKRAKLLKKHQNLRSVNETTSSENDIHNKGQKPRKRKQINILKFLSNSSSTNDSSKKKFILHVDKIPEESLVKSTNLRSQISENIKIRNYKKTELKNVVNLAEETDKHVSSPNENYREGVSPLLKVWKKESPQEGELLEIGRNQKRKSGGRREGYGVINHEDSLPADIGRHFLGVQMKKEYVSTEKEKIQMCDSGGMVGLQDEKQKEIRKFDPENIKQEVCFEGTCDMFQNSSPTENCVDTSPILFGNFENRNSIQEQLLPQDAVLYKDRKIRSSLVKIVPSSVMLPRKSSDRYTDKTAQQTEKIEFHCSEEDEDQFQFDKLIRNIKVEDILKEFLAKGGALNPEFIGHQGAVQENYGTIPVKDMLSPSPCTSKSQLRFNELNLEKSRIKSIKNKSRFLKVQLNSSNLEGKSRIDVCLGKLPPPVEVASTSKKDANPREVRCSKVWRQSVESSGGRDHPQRSSVVRWMNTTSSQSTSLEIDNLLRRTYFMGQKTSSQQTLEGSF